jgi:hypothetical protein
MAESTWHLGGLGMGYWYGNAVQIWPPYPIRLMYQQGLYVRDSNELLLFSVGIILCLEVFLAKDHEILCSIKS